MLVETEAAREVELLGLPHGRRELIAVETYGAAVDPETRSDKANRNTDWESML